MAKSLLVILELGQTVPSAYTRAVIYRDHFKRAGFDARFMSRLAPALRGAPRLNRLFARLNENRIAHAARRCSVVYLCKVRSERLPVLIRRRSRARIVLDTVDASWLRNRQGTSFGKILSLVDAVSTDNPYTAEYIRRYNTACFLVPDPAQVELFDEKRAELRKPDSDLITLGWIGSQDTAYNLYVIWEALEALFARRKDITLRLVGAGTRPGILPRFENVTFTTLPAYTRDDMIREVLGMDIGLFPLQDVEECRARGVLKACIYMSGGAALLCSPVGQLPEVVADGVNGMFAAGPADWERKLELLISSRQLRRQLSEAGLKTVRSGFTVDKCFSILQAVLDPKIPASAGHPSLVSQGTV